MENKRELILGNGLPLKKYYRFVEIHLESFVLENVPVES